MQMSCYLTLCPWDEILLRKTNCENSLIYKLRYDCISYAMARGWWLLGVHWGWRNGEIIGVPTNSMEDEVVVRLITILFLNFSKEQGGFQTLKAMLVLKYRLGFYYLFVSLLWETSFSCKILEYTFFR